MPGKNLRSFFGRPIISYAIEAARQAECFSEIMVSTDCPEIAEVARQSGAQVPFFRSVENASDLAPTGAVWQEVITEYLARQRTFALACSVLATSPFVTAPRLREAVALMEAHPDWDALMAVVAYSPPIQRALHLQDGELTMVWPEHMFARSQDLTPRYHDSGQYYAFRPDFLLKAGNLRKGRLGAAMLPADEVQDIDSEEDWQLAEMKYERMLRKTR